MPYGLGFGLGRYNRGGAGGGGGGNNDPFWANVVLCLNMVGTAGTAVFTDSSSKGHVITPNGVLLASASPPPGYATYGAFLGITGITALHSIDWAYFTGDFTIEGWLKSSATGQRRIYSVQQSSPLNALGIRQSSAGKLESFAFNGGTQSINLTGTTTIANTGTWYYYSLSRQGNNVYLAINGVLEASQNIGTASIPDVPSNLGIGYRSEDGSEVWTGSLGPMRVTKGTGRYGAASYVVPSGIYPTS